MSTLTSIESFNVEQTIPACFGNVTYDIATLKKAGTLSVGYGSYYIVFTSVADYLTFVNQIIVPLTNKIHSASGSGVGYVGGSSGTAGADPIVDAQGYIMPQLALNIVPYKADNKGQLDKLFSCCMTLSDSVKILKDSITRYEEFKKETKISTIGSQNDDRS